MSMDKLNGALARALADLHEPHKGGKANTGTYGYTYLTLPDLSAVVREAFARHGLAFTQHVETLDGGVKVTTRLVHETGATWRTEPLVMPAQARTPQGLGSAITYARRYQLAALVGLSGSDDDDGNQASAPEPHAEAAPRPASPVGKRGSGAVHTDGPKKGPTGDAPLTDAQRRRLWATARAKGYGDKPTLVAYAAGHLGWDTYDEDRLSHLTKAEASKLIDALQAEVLAERLDQPPEDDPWYGKTEELVPAQPSEG